MSPKSIYLPSIIILHSIEILTEEAEEVLVNDYQPISDRKPEVCIVDVPSIVIVIETGFGYYTYPMLVIETKMNAQIRDWSSEVIFFSIQYNHYD